MNWQHLQAFLWLRWRLLLNQTRRGGPVNAVVAIILTILAVLFAGVMFITFLLVGLLALRDVTSDILLYVWDGLVIAFLFSWTMGMLVELQRSEILSLDKFLHLPVSLKGVFLINYVSSLFSLSALAFLPAMAALAIAQVVTNGLKMLVLFPLLAVFLFMVTAVTYQFQGWLASIMVNKQRRRTVIVLVTVVFVLVCQTPMFMNIVVSRSLLADNDLGAKYAEDNQRLLEALQAKKITPEEYEKQQGEIESEYQTQKTEAGNRLYEQVVYWIRIINKVLPIGWLPLGAVDAAQGKIWAALLGGTGMTLIGSVSLWRSYRTTLRLYTGQFTSAKRVVAPVAAPAKTAKPSDLLLEKQLPWLSEQAAVIALGGFRALIRAPEAKMMLLTPVLLVIIFGSMFMTRTMQLPEFARPMPAFGGMAMILLSMGQLIGNQFGFDRSGFRVYVLSAAPRRDILLGKNLAAAPLALGLGVVVVVLVQVLQPMRPEHFAACAPQMLTMYLLYCPVANLLSLLAPMPIRAGTLKPANPKVVPILLHVVFAFVFPLVVAPALLPLGVEIIVEAVTKNQSVPICLLLALVELVVVVFVYRFVLTWEGNLLQAREQRILEIVTTKAE